MIYYSKGNCDLLQQDVVVLDHTDGDLKGHIILSRDMYDRLVLMSDKFCNNYILVERKISARNQEAAVEYFAECAPEPVDILAPFLHLVKCEEVLPLDVEVLCGYLHVISMSIKFDLYLEVSEEVRKSVLFSYRQVSEYVGLWKDLEVRVKLAEVDEDTVTKEFIRSLTVEVAKGILSEVLGEVKELANAVVYSAPKGAVMQPLAGGFDQQGVAPLVQPVVDVVQEGIAESAEGEAEDMNTFFIELLADEVQAIEEGGEEEEMTEKEGEEQEEESAHSAERSVIDSIVAMYGGV